MLERDVRLYALQMQKEHMQLKGYNFLAINYLRFKIYQFNRSVVIARKKQRRNRLRNEIIKLNDELLQACEDLETIEANINSLGSSFLE